MVLMVKLPKLFKRLLELRQELHLPLILLKLPTSLLSLAGMRKLAPNTKSIGKRMEV
jgi:hypothetical protein